MSGLFQARDQLLKRKSQKLSLIRGADMSRKSRKAAQDAIIADEGAARYRHYFEPYLTKNERLVWAGRSSALSTFLTYLPIWWVSLPAMALSWALLPHSGPAVMPFLVALALSVGPVASAIVAHWTFFALTQRRALFLVHMTRWHRSFAPLDLRGVKPWVGSAPLGAGTVFIAFVGRPSRHKRFTDGYGNMGFWRISDHTHVAALAERIGRTLQ